MLAKSGKWLDKAIAEWQLAKSSKIQAKDKSRKRLAKT